MIHKIFHDLVSTSSLASDSFPLRFYDPSALAFHSSVIRLSPTWDLRCTFKICLSHFLVDSANLSLHVSSLRRWVLTISIRLCYRLLLLCSESCEYMVLKIINLKHTICIWNIYLNYTYMCYLSTKQEMGMKEGIIIFSCCNKTSQPKANHRRVYLGLWSQRDKNASQ